MVKDKARKSESDDRRMSHPFSKLRSIADLSFTHVNHGMHAIWSSLTWFVDHDDFNELYSAEVGVSTIKDHDHSQASQIFRKTCENGL